ncbi:Oidioi.mRNA.OKI2018_I69.XSR.g14100.t1.cds [Oikopleura dioica]|uniref:Oidioi.mRNA.OKI2018_I69.XSR.g14100.t1.cds n=1 Tax=Oikopleura dioica TaxID=34765 RepID=A0ABN7S8Y1_OIKDI|nr:Oidioi.mRNA.OKI2018_I69.XSR.g14100.t1.cds [Oikopleura dioica]
MFWLEHKTKNLRVPMRFDHTYQITRPAKQAIDFGENTTALVIKADKSISRKHAKIVISHDKVLKKIVVSIQDESKYSSKVRLNAEADWRKVISSDHSDKSSFNYTEPIELGIVFGVYSTEFQITGKPLLFYCPFPPSNPQLPQFIAFKEFSVETEEDYEYLLYQGERTDDLFAEKTLRVKDVPLVKMEYFLDLKKYIYNPNHPKEDLAVGEPPKIEEYFVEKKKKEPEVKLFESDDSENEEGFNSDRFEEDLLAPDSFFEDETDDDDGVDIDPNEKLMTAEEYLREHDMAGPSNLEYTSRVPETEFNLTRQNDKAKAPVEASEMDYSSSVPETVFSIPPAVRAKPKEQPILTGEARRAAYRKFLPKTPEKNSQAINAEIELSVIGNTQDRRMNFFDEDDDIPLAREHRERLARYERMEKQKALVNSRYYQPSRSGISASKTGMIRQTPVTLEPWMQAGCSNHIAGPSKRQSSMEIGNSSKGLKTAENDQVQEEEQVFEDLSTLQDVSNYSHVRPLNIFEKFRFAKWPNFKEENVTDPDENNSWVKTVPRKVHERTYEDNKAYESIQFSYFNPRMDEWSDEVKIPHESQLPTKKPKIIRRKSRVPAMPPKKGTEPKEGEEKEPAKPKRKTVKERKAERFASQDLSQFMSRKR